MNLVDIVGGKVVIHPDLYFIPAFKRLYEHDTSEDKVHQELVITYIVLMHKWSSPYKKSMDAHTREIRLKEQVFEDPNYELTTLMVEEGKSGNGQKDRATEIDIICKRLTEKYEAKHKEGKSGAGDTELSADNTEVSDNEELLESECTDEESNGDSTEIK